VKVARALPLLMALLLAACGKAAVAPAPAGKPAGSPPVDKPAATATLQAAARPGAVNVMVEEYFIARRALQPAWAASFGLPPAPGAPVEIAPQAIANRLRLDRDALARALALDVRGLSAAEQFTHALFVHDLREGIEGAHFPDELLPFSAPDGGFGPWTAQAAARGVVPLATAAQREAWLEQLALWPSWVRQVEANLIAGQARGVALPAPGAEWVARRVAAVAKSPFALPPATLRSLATADREAFVRRHAEVLETQVRPAIARLQQVVAERMVPGARTTEAWVDLPLGADWYAYRLRVATGLPLDAKAWHQAGEREVARLEAVLQAMRGAVGPGAPEAADVGPPVPAPPTARPPLRLEPLPIAAVPRWRRVMPRLAHRHGYGLYRALSVESPAEQALEAARQAAAMIVVDTGLHAERWTRTQAAEYLTDHTVLSPAAAEERVDAALTLPTVWLAPGAGYLRLRQLREEAERVQGPRFDAAAFDRQLAVDGPLPLGILEDRIRRWLRAG
jgi:uncharacterized protein (DUF885 family)